MKDAFWTSGSTRHMSYTFTRQAIAAKDREEKAKLPPPPPPEPEKPPVRKCGICGDMTRNPCG
jgi:hypothetical protein